jgi:hypothetical protein
MFKATYAVMKASNELEKPQEPNAIVSGLL